MKYEIYKQEDSVDTEKVTRYHTQVKAVAFYFMNEKNKIAGKNIWRVAKCIEDRICFDIDIPDIDNLKNIIIYYSDIFNTEFTIIKTNGGFHLISKKKYTDKVQWLYDECRIVYPLLDITSVTRYINDVQKFYRESSKKERKIGDKKEFLDRLAQEFKDSPMFMGYGDFDILFSINALFRGYHCIRISKKHKDDYPEIIYTV